MVRRILTSGAALLITAGSAAAQTIIYDDGFVGMSSPVIVERRAAVIPTAPVIVERRAAVIPTAPVIVAPADRFVIVDDFDIISPGAPSGQDPLSDEKRTVGDDRRDALDRFYRSRPVVVYR